MLWWQFANDCMFFFVSTLLPTIPLSFPLYHNQRKLQCTYMYRFSDSFTKKEPFERYLSKLSENQKIVEIGSMILISWQLKNVQNEYIQWYTLKYSVPSAKFLARFPTTESKMRAAIIHSSGMASCSLSRSSKHTMSSRSGTNLVEGGSL